ncbi:MAG: CRISPR-associated endonuclease Cas3'', partial [Lautropia sp.]
MEFFAHSTSNPDRSDWQPLREHLLASAERCARHAALFGGESLAWPLGALHDLGKYTERFQDRLRGDPTRVDHATWGARIARERYGPLGLLLAYGIAGHHAGLANGDDGERRSSLRERLSETYRDQALPPLLPDWEAEIALPRSVDLPQGFRAASDPELRNFQLALLTRMLFSCLVDADFIDTDNYYRRIEKAPLREEGMGPSLTLLHERLDAHLATLPNSDGINPLRADILHHVRNQSGMSPGLFSLTVPTGGGKTLASLAFALDHAITHGLRRVIYVIPFTSIVEQNAQVFRDAFGELGESAVLEHHSAFFEDPKSGLQAIRKRRLAMENWDAPVVVTTAVQFFESLFADRPSRCRKLHNIPGSVVILDEAQTMPLPLLRPCVALLQELARNYRMSIVTCTATQPALREDQGFRNGLSGVRELAKDPPALYQRLRRVHVRHVGQVDDAALADLIRRRHQALCIVNNRRHARALFESIDDDPGSFHLTTLMFARHRSQVLAEIRRLLREGATCRLISTSLIEAGVDVDFPMV